jgi:hypothetical protein
MTQEVDQNTIIELSLLLEKYRQYVRTSATYARHELSKEIVTDLEHLKDTMVKRTTND